MTVRQKFVALVLAAVATAALGWGARASYDFGAEETGVLRLSWRLRGEREERCRARTAAELAELPVHMRTPEVCEGHLVAYRLVVEVDGVVRDTATVLPGGARGDRPIFVFREFPLAPGAHAVSVTLERADHRSPPLTFDANLTASPGAVELITLDPEARRLVHRTSLSR